MVPEPDPLFSVTSHLFFFQKKTTVVLPVTYSLLLLIDTRRQSFDCQILPAAPYVQLWTTVT